MVDVQIVNQVLNYKGLINSLDIKVDEYLLPLFEVVVNAIQSIEDRNIDNGNIHIVIHRLSQQSLALDETSPYNPIIGFTVTDNGVGFTDKRFEAFSTPFTNFNSGKGGKGMGRYTVLACFGSMEIDSYYLSQNLILERNLRFDNANGLQHIIKDENSKINADQGSTVRLKNYKKKYADYINDRKVSKSEIGEGIIQHCLLYFINGSAPSIYVREELEEVNDSTILNDIYKTVIKIEKTEKDIKIPNVNETFNINYIKNFNGVHAHSIHLCANNRQVGEKETLTKYIPTFRELHDEKKSKYHLSLYVTSKFLDRKVHAQRNKLMLPEATDKKKEFDGVSLQELYNSVADNVKSNYSDFIDEAEKERNSKVKNYILDKNKPRLRYRHLINVENAFSDIPINASKEVMEAKLHEKSFKLEQKREKEFQKIFKKKKYDKDAFGKIVNDVLREEVSFSKDKLADLMINRKSVMKLFRKYLQWRTEENYMLEEDLHNIIFTMGADSNNIPDDYHNLWLLDERLTFHSFTASDKQLRSNTSLKSPSQKEPDLFVYDVPWAYTDNPDKINSMVLFEFKRPGRDMNTSEDKKLDSQLENYFVRLLKSKAKNHKGRFINIENMTPKFGYIVCDLHKDLKKYNIEFNGFNETPQGTLYKINDKLNLYYEVIDYNDVVSFAEKRHEAFFKALGIDNL